MTRQQPARPTRSRVGLANLWIDPTPTRILLGQRPPIPNKTVKVVPGPRTRSDNLLAERSDVPNNPTYLADQTRPRRRVAPNDLARPDPAQQHHRGGGAAAATSPRLNAGKPRRPLAPMCHGHRGRASRGPGARMNVKAVVFGFFVLLAATLNFGFFVGDLDDPTLHNVYPLFAAVVVNLIATALQVPRSHPRRCCAPRH